MKLIVKYLLRNIMEKKSRTFLMIFSITICCSLFFGTIAISLTIEDIYVQKIRSQIGSAEIMVTPGTNKEKQFFENDYESDDIEYAIGCVIAKGYEQSKVKGYITLYGYNLDELDKMNPIIMIKQETSSFEGEKVILSESYADELKVKVGDSVNMNVLGNDTKYQVWGISNDYGIFEKNNSQCVIVPKKTLQEQFELGDKVNAIYLKNKDGKSIDTIMDDLTDHYSEETVAQTITKKEIESYTNRITQTFLLMLLAVIVISVFIIYTSFRIIVTERMSILATFRSVGATKVKTTAIFLVEAATYALISGILGCILGVGLDYAMSRISTPKWLAEANGIHLKLQPYQFVMTILLAIVMTLLSAIIPILLSNKYSIRRLLFGDFSNKGDKKLGKLILGVVFIASAIILSIIAPLKSAIILNAVALILFIVGVILCIPLFINIFVFAGMKIFSGSKSGSIKTALLNLRDNKSVRNNIILLVIGISSIFIINTARQGVFGAIINIYDSLDYSARLTADDLPKAELEKIQAIDSVEDAYGLYQLSNVDVQGKDSKIKMIWGCNDTNFKDFVMLDYGVKGQDEILDKLENSRSVLLTYTVSELLNVHTGDKVELKLGDSYYSYEVAGVFNTMINYGNFALVSAKNLEKDANLDEYSEIDIKAKDVEQLETEIKNQTGIEYPQIANMKDEKKSVLDSNQQIYTILIFFSLMTIVIGCIGTINNFIISFIERKKGFAILRSIGMSNVSCTRMVLLEALFSGIFAGVFGNVSGLLMSTILVKLIAGIGIPISIHYTVLEFLAYLGASILITFLCSLSMCRKLKQIYIIEALKYE